MAPSRTDQANASIDRIGEAAHLVIDLGSDTCRLQRRLGADQFAVQAETPVPAHRGAHVLERASRDDFDLGDLDRRTGRVGGQQAAGQLRLERDEREPVAEEVMKIAGDPDSLVGGRETRDLGSRLVPVRR